MKKSVCLLMTLVCLLSLCGCYNAKTLKNVVWVKEDNPNEGIIFTDDSCISWLANKTENVAVLQPPVTIKEYKLNGNEIIFEEEIEVDGTIKTTFTNNKDSLTIKQTAKTKEIRYTSTKKYKNTNCSSLAEYYGQFNIGIITQGSADFVPKWENEYWYKGKK